jgi:hypothetical protein
MKSIRSAVCAVAVLAVTGVAVAAESPADGLRRCAAVTDSLARLVCFDQLSAAAPAAAVAPAAPVSTAPTGSAAPAAAVGLAAGTAAVATQAELGDDNLKGSQRKDAATKPTSLTAQVSELLETRTDTYRISLDNGQVWQQEEVQSAAFTIKVGDTVRIEKGKMGGYSLAVVRNGEASGRWIRVTRKE